MAKRSVGLRLTDILTAIGEAEQILDGADFGAYEADVGKRRGVERCLEIISEASRFLPEELKQKHPDIPWPEIRGMGNHLRHGYQRISDHIIWRAAAKDLATLKPATEKLLSELDDPPST